MLLENLVFLNCQKKNSKIYSQTKLIRVYKANEILFFFTMYLNFSDNKDPKPALVFSTLFVKVRLSIFFVCCKLIKIKKKN